VEMSAEYFTDLPDLDHLPNTFDPTDEASNDDYLMDDGNFESYDNTGAVAQDSPMDELSEAHHVFAQANPTRLPLTACLFCYFDSTLGEDRRSISVFTARSSMQRHAQNTHFRDMRASRLWVCPDPACHGMPFENEDHLKNHAATAHLVLFAATRSV
jgi:hypothetical protein